MRFLNFRFSLNNPFFHGIAIGLVISLMFPQAAGATEPQSEGIDSALLYALIDVSDDDLKKIHQTATKAVGKDAITFEITGAPDPASGIFDAVSNDGDEASIEISRYEPLYDALTTPDGITTDDVNSVFQAELELLKTNFDAEVDTALADMSTELGVNPDDITCDFLSLPDINGDFETARKSLGIGIVRFLALDGEITIVPSIISKSISEGQAKTLILPMADDISSEEADQFDLMPRADFLMGIDSTDGSFTDDGDVQASWITRVRCIASATIAIAAVLTTLTAILGCLNSPGFAVCLIAAFAMCRALAAGQILGWACNAGV